MNINIFETNRRKEREQLGKEDENTNKSRERKNQKSFEKYPGEDTEEFKRKMNNLLYRSIYKIRV